LRNMRVFGMVTIKISRKRDGRKVDITSLFNPQTYGKDTVNAVYDSDIMIDF